MLSTSLYRGFQLLLLLALCLPVASCDIISDQASDDLDWVGDWKVTSDNSSADFELESYWSFSEEEVEFIGDVVEGADTDCLILSYTVTNKDGNSVTFVPIGDQDSELKFRFDESGDTMTVTVVDVPAGDVLDEGDEFTLREIDGDPRQILDCES